MLAAYILVQILRGLAARSACAATQVRTLRDCLLKAPVGVERSVRRTACISLRLFPDTRPGRGSRGPSAQPTDRLRGRSPRDNQGPRSRCDQQESRYLVKAQKRLKALAVLRDEKAHSDVVREAQELVKLALKEMLRAAGVEPPKFHDVGGLLLEHESKFSRDTRGQMPRAADNLEASPPRPRAGLLKQKAP